MLTLCLLFCGKQQNIRQNGTVSSLVRSLQLWLVNSKEQIRINNIKIGGNDYVTSKKQKFMVTKCV